jgi:glycosyltransferase involved in cell wall biosynthesis
VIEKITRKVWKLMPTPVRHFGNIFASSYFNFTHVNNFYHTNFSRRALISYITMPYILPETYLHTNTLESRLIAQAFHELGYQVDIYNYTYSGKINYDMYDVIFGFGTPVVNSFRLRTRNIKVISYIASMHNYVQNLQTLNRIEQFHQKHGIWLLNAGRFIPQDWTSITVLSDAVITLGNDIVAESYRRFTPKPVYVLPSLFFKVFDYKEIVKNKNYINAANNFLWFGGTGVIHKGLDLVLDAFSQLPDMELHVCGNLENESAFLKHYRTLLNHSANIHIHGFVHLDAPRFRVLLATCCFAILPSCSEGGGSSVINLCANGGIIPVVTRESSVTTNGFGIEISHLTSQAVVEATQAAAHISSDELRKRSLASGEYFHLNNNTERYQMKLMEALQELL